MSKSIDERIVDLQFNNKQFETGIKDSMQSIEDLKKGLNDMDGVSKGLDAAGNAAEKCGSLFTALEVVAATALAKLTSAVIDFGLTAAKSLLLESITQGFSAYEAQVSATKAIMNATRRPIEEVTEALKPLIFFADETSFSFDQMVGSVRLFTATGIKLEDATTAMQGIGSASALAGVSLNDMQTVFDSLSKAIGSGTLRSMEWQRLERAGLATSIEFKEELIKTAVEMGTLTKVGDKFYTKTADASGKINKAEVSLGNMRDTLKENWATADVLMKLFGEFGGFAQETFLLVEASTMDLADGIKYLKDNGIDMVNEMPVEEFLEGLGGEALLAYEAMNLLSDGTEHFSERGMRAAQEARTLTDTLEAITSSIAARWRQSFGIIIGDVDEATELFSGLVEVLWEVFVVSGDTRNSLLGLWKDMGGREVLFEGLANVGKILVGEDGTGGILGAIKEAWTSIFPPKTADQLLEMTENFRDFTEKITPTPELLEKITTVFEGLFAVLDIVKMSVGGVFDIFGEVIKVFLPVGDGVSNLVVNLSEFAVSLRDSMKESEFWGNIVSKIGEILGNVSAAISKFVSDVKTDLEPIVSKIGEVLGNVSTIISKFVSDIKTDFIDVFGPVEGILQKFKDFLGTIGDGIKDGVSKIAEHMQGFAIIKLDALKNFTENVEISFRPFTFLANIFKAAWEGIIKVWEWAAPVVVPLAQKIGDAIAKFGEAFGKAVTSGDFQTFLNLINTGVITSILLGLKSFVEGLKDFTGNASSVLDGMKSVLDGVRGSLEAYQTKLKADALMKIALAIGVLVASIWVLSGIEASSITTALAAITVLFIELSAVMLALGKNTMGSAKLMATATAMLAISAAILVLSLAVKSLAGLEMESLAQGLAAVAVILAEVAGFTRIVKPEQLISAGVGMIAFAAAVVILSGAVKSLGSLDVEALKKGLISVGVLLAEIAGFSHIVKPSNLLAAGVAMIPVATGITILAGAVKILSSIDIESLKIGLIGLGISLAAIGTFAQLVDPVRLLAAGAAMIPIGAGITIIAGALKIMGSMTWDELAVGISAMAASLAILAAIATVMVGTLSGSAAMVVMSAAILLLAPALMMLGSMDLVNIGLALLALAGTFVIVGVAGLVLGPLTPVIIGLAAAIALLGVGVLAIGGGLLAFSAGLTALAVAGTAGVAALSTVILTIINLIPAAVTALAEGILKFIKVIGDGTPIIMDAMKNIIQGLVQILVELAPMLVDAVFVFLDKILDTANKFIPKLVDTGLKLFLGILEGVSKNIQDIVTVALKILSEFLQGIANGIPGVVESGVNIVIAFMEAIAKEGPRLVDAGFKMMIEFMNGLADAIRDNAAELGEAAANLGMSIIEGLILGLAGMVGEVVNKIVEIGKALWDGFKNFFGIHSPSTLMATEGGNVVEGIIRGLGDGMANVVKKAIEIGKAIFDGIKEKVANIKDVGSEMLSNLGTALSNGISSIKDKAVSIGSAIYNGISDKVADFKEIGQNIISTLGDTLQKGMTSLATKAQGLGNSILNGAKSALGIASPSKEFEAIADNIVTTTADTIGKKSSKAAKAAEKMSKDTLDAAKLWIKDYKNSTEYLASEELAMWELLGSKYAQGSKERVEIDKEALKLREQVIKEEAALRKADFEEQKALIENKRKLGQVALFEELDEWLAVQERYAEGTNERLLAEQEMINAIIEHRKLGEVSLLEEYDLWSFMQTRYVEGTEERKRVELELHDVKKRIHEEQKRLSEEIDKIEADYAKSVDDRAKQIAQSYGIFAEVKEKEKIAGKDLMKNLQDQVAELQNWASNIEQLSKSAIDEGLLEELRKMGPSASAEMSALVAMSDEELTQYSDLWKQKNNMARTAAISELSGLRADADSEITKLREELEKLTITDVSNFTKSGEEASGAMIGGFESKFNAFTQAGKEATAAMELGLKSNEKVYKQTGSKYGEDFSTSMSNAQTAAKVASTAVTNNAEQGIKSNAAVYGQTGTKYGSDFSNYFSNTQTAARIASTTVTNNAEQGIKSNATVYGQTGTAYGEDFSNSFSKTQTSAKTSGEAVTNSAEQGVKSNATVYGQTGTTYGGDFSKGISDQQTTATTAGKSLSEAATNGINATLAEFATAGANAGQGFVNGLNSMQSSVESAARSLAQAANRAFQATLEINSPSKVFFGNAVYTALGFIDGVRSMISRVEESGAEIGDAAIDGIKSVIDEAATLIDKDVSSDLVISPVLDLSDVQNGIGILRKALSSAEMKTTAGINVKQISSHMSGINEVSETPGRATRGETKYEFTQNNYSPKALTRLEIYRQTRNQFAQLKGLVEA